MRLSNPTRNTRRLVPLFAALGLWALIVPSAAAQPPAAQKPPAANQQPPAAAQQAPRIVVDDDGTVHVPALAVPQSAYLSPEGKAYVTQHLKDMLNPPPAGPEKGVPGFMAGYLARQRVLYPSDREDTTIAGVHVYVYTPKAGISDRNRTRVLINLHGGGFSGCWPGCAELESIPVAGVGRIKVVSVDYREGPEFKHPAASEDVAAVYKELLKTYRPANVGIFGCSAGGMLTAMSVAWFQTHNLPNPGAVGIYCAGAGNPAGVSGIGGGDAAYTSVPLGEARVPMAPRAPRPSAAPTGARGGGRGAGPGYLGGTDPKDPMVNPIASDAVMSKFPPTQIITGTRGMELSSALYTHQQLVKLGVEADLHVWEGLFHGFFYNPDVPECKDAYNVMVKFFDRHLGR
jgi:monoterpene epsilon-lactone hydrolase